jgi:uncharacterized protein with HEPN domain
MRDDRERLRDILEAIERIENYVDRGEGAFRRDELIQTWMTRNIQVIGEAARGISQEFRDNYPEIPWSRIIGMRHVLVHILRLTLILYGESSATISRGSNLRYMRSFNTWRAGHKINEAPGGSKDEVLT